MKNYNIMFALRILKEILETFLESFLVLYFIEVTDGNILPLGIYKLIEIFTIFVVMFLTRNFCKSKNRVILIRIGIIINLIYFITILFLRERIINYIYLIRIIIWIRRRFLLFHI